MAIEELPGARCRVGRVYPQNGGPSRDECVIHHAPAGHLDPPPDPVAERRARAVHAAESATGNAEVEVLLVALCTHRRPDGALCLEDVARAVTQDTDSLVLSPWAHMVRRLDEDHPVVGVRAAASLRYRA